MEKWISVKDRLPDLLTPHESSVEEYLVTVATIGEPVVTTDTFTKAGWWMHNDITHWMPLPKPATN